MIRSNFESIKSHIAKMRHKNAPSKSVNFSGVHITAFNTIPSKLPSSVNAYSDIPTVPSSIIILSNTPL